MIDSPRANLVGGLLRVPVLEERRHRAEERRVEAGAADHHLASGDNIRALIRCVAWRILKYHSVEMREHRDAEVALGRVGGADVLADHHQHRNVQRGTVPGRRWMDDRQVMDDRWQMGDDRCTMASGR